MIRPQADDVMRARQEAASMQRARASGFVPRRMTLAMPDPSPAVSADSLTVFVATQLVNPLNARGHWGANAKRAKRQREAVALAVWCALRHPKGPGLAWTVVNPAAPKRITFTAHVARKFDDDGLVASLKAIRDGLIDAGLYLSDGPAEGHLFHYAQVVATPLGVEIRVALA